MWHVVVLTVAVTVAATMASAIPDIDEGHKSRVIDRELSDRDHFTDDDGTAPHHNVEYDHEAFLGKDEEKSFDNLTPEESKERLAIIFDKIDKDQDGVISEAELIEWIKYVQTRYMRTDTDRQWRDYYAEGEDTAKLTWDQYAEKTYGHIEGLDKADEKDDDDDSEHYDYRQLMKRDKRRWAMADTDNDALLSKDEFMNFLHPEEVDSMKDIVVDETLEDIDKDRDGLISLQEYIGDMWPESYKENPGEEPDWVKTEREQFSTYRDKNKDGYLDRVEVKDWIIPDDYDHASAEAKHLIYESDGDRDGSLSKTEVLDKYDLFVGSQATDFGEALTKHDVF